LIEIEEIKWSPDGSKIAFAICDLRGDRGDHNIYVIDVP
jgi:Tol biopolymer transport system component